jgi:alpha-ketoglutarate-dependent taurine dioxygenase
MAETIALDAELGAEFVDYGDVANLLDEAVIAQCREALKWRGAAQRRVNPDATDEELASWRTVPTHESSLVWQRRDGRRSLVIGATAEHIVGVAADESRELLDELLAWATQSRFCYTHTWSVGDAVLWDNTAVLHRALPYDPASDRMLRRTHIKGQEAWA